MNTKVRLISNEQNGVKLGLAERSKWSQIQAVFHTTLTSPNRSLKMSDSPGPASDSAAPEASRPFLKAKFRIGSCKGPKNFSFSESVRRK